MQAGRLSCVGRFAATNEGKQNASTATFFCCAPALQIGFSIRNKQAKPAAGNEFLTDVWITEFRAARVAEAANPDR